ncbi:rhodanese-like domain-containing protein [Streptomyces yokosukanensis]|uniref:rhodanese-like domain-containing protein n=1 Tax=Streptomyces yokosukanensis TaxID=67386 RepID=UPI00341DCCEA
MSPFGRGRGCPGRAGTPEAAARTGRARSAAPPLPLDVRDAHDWHTGPAPGAVRPPLAAPARGDAPPHSAQARPVVVIRRSGDPSWRAGAQLCARGVRAVGVMGGMRARAEAGLPVVGARGGNGTVG